ncbi:glycosyltransferase [Polynucleobacter sp. MWH-CaK5]|uniref:glycosyltransferase n=1 Tax=Polynucleobacter sp. MWH-CaK5 TaxID=2689107 RepID=UPI001BFD7CCE|nr:glycosyltransferase [Polynucleobacter sp. MWH-CaK5]QWD89170.1 glycosyltransferase [Polynucleobacter sp. MWH-CaK5]
MNSSKSKICIVCATPLTVHFFFKRHIEGLANFSDVDLLINLSNEKFTPDIDLPIKVIDFPITRQIKLISDIKVLLILVKHLILNKYDLVWGIGPKAGLISMLASCICRVRCRLFIFQGEVWASKQGIGRFLLKKLDRLTVRLATSVLAVGFSEKKYLESQGVAKKDQIQILGSGSICGVDLKKFNVNRDVKEKLRSDLSIQLQARVCLFLGRINRDKGILDLVDAFKLAHQKSPNLFLLIIGPDEFGLNQLIQSELVGYENSYKILDFVTDTEKYYSVADFFCLPSYREGFPISILEAAASGIPTIGSDIYGINDALINGVTGIQFPVGDIAALANSLLKFSDNSEYCEGLGISARNRVVLNYEQSMVCDRYVNFMRELLKN